MPSSFVPLISGDLVRQLEWKRYQEAVALYFELTGKSARESALGADGGIDVRLYDYANSLAPYAVVQCKAWSPRGEIDVTEIRAFTDVMREAAVDQGYYFATCRIPPYIKAEACRRGIETVDTEEFVARLSDLPAQQQRTWLAGATHGDFRTPTCRKCGAKMKPRRANARAWWWWCDPCRLDQPMRREDRERYEAASEVPPVLAHHPSPREIRRHDGALPGSHPPPRLEAAATSPRRLHPAPGQSRAARHGKFSALLGGLGCVGFGVWMIAHAVHSFFGGVTVPVVARPPPASLPRPSAATRATPAPPANRSPSWPAHSVPIATNVSPTTQPQLRFHMPRAIFHLNIEANSTATDEQLRHATSAIESALSVFDRLARPPFLAIATPPDSTHPSLTGYLIYDTHLDDFVSREVYFAAPQPNRTVAIVHRYPCYFVGGERIAR